MPEAISDFQEALRLDPAHMVALDNLGTAYRHLQNWEEARKIFEQAAEIEAR